mgnify:CR=1 FL=1
MSHQNNDTPKPSFGTPLTNNRSSGDRSSGPENSDSSDLDQKDPGRKVAPQRALTKADLVDSVYEIVGGETKKEAVEIIEGLFHILKSTLASGENVKVSGFGNWIVKQKKPRLGRNPQTGEAMTITARKVVSFKPSQILKSAIDPE